MKTNPFEWLVIGAGAAGIAAVGKLIDSKVVPEKIGWIDPHFAGGDLGAKWRHVSSNTKVKLFLRFLNNCPAFEFDRIGREFPLTHLNPEETCLLENIAEPLIAITKHLRKKVHSIEGNVIALNRISGAWEAKMEKEVVCAKNVILAIGAEPKKLSFPETPEIPLEIALDPEKLKQTIKKGETIGVFGCSHSAILILDNLLKAGAHQVVNFYRSPHLYAVYLDDWILFDDTGLKGHAAEWAKENLDKSLPPNLVRVLATDRKFDEVLATCNRLIYAVGFERRKLPVIEEYNHFSYNDRTGIIAPGLFGLGIAFPEAKLDRLGNLEYRVGLWKFMDYLNGIMPIWLKYSS